MPIDLDNLRYRVCKPVFGFTLILNIVCFGLTVGVSDSYAQSVNKSEKASGFWESLKSWGGLGVSAVDNELITYELIDQDYLKTRSSDLDFRAGLGELRILDNVFNEEIVSASQGRLDVYRLNYDRQVQHKIDSVIGYELLEGTE